MDKLEAALTCEIRITTNTKPPSVFNRDLQGEPVAASDETSQLNSPNPNLEVGHAIFVKEEFTELDLGSDFDCKSIDFACQPVKSEDEAALRDEYNSEGQFQTNSPSPRINFLTRIKLEGKREEDYRDQLPQSIHDHKTELSSQSSGIGMDSESGGNNLNSGVDPLHPCLDFVTLSTERQSAFNLFTQIKNEVNGEDDTGVDPLNTSTDVKNEVPLESPEFLNVHEIEDRKLIERTVASRDPLNYSATTKYGRYFIDQTGPRRLADVNDGISTDVDTETSQNQDPTEEFRSSRRENEREREPFICRHCSASFSRNIDLDRHVCHTVEKSFNCIHCSASFARKRYLHRHIRMHTGEKPFSCAHCSTSFARRTSLNRHIRMHTGEKPFSCAHCSASFAQRVHLSGHMRIHTGEKPFTCVHCSASFARRGNLDLHMRTHTGEKPFICAHCSSSFAQRNSLNRHMRMHTGEKPFSCVHCSASFTRKYYLNKHLEAHSSE